MNLTLMQLNPYTSYGTKVNPFPFHETTVSEIVIGDKRDENQNEKYRIVV